MLAIPDSYDARLALELAQGFEPPEKIYPRYGLSKEEWTKLRKTKEFRMMVERYLVELQKDGTSFKNKAGVLAEELLYVAHSVASNTDNAPDTRMESLKWLAKVSGKDDSGNKNPTSNAPPFMISINLGEHNTPKLVFDQPAAVTDE